MAHRIISIVRQCGSGGAYIGAKAAEILGIPCYNQEILQMALELGDLNDAKHVELFKKVDEKKPNMAFYRTYREGDEKYVSPDESASDQLFDLEKKLMLHFAEHEDAILIGRCSNWVLRQADIDVDLISIYVMGSLENRIKRIVRNSDMDEAAAKRHIKKTDRQRNAFYYYMTHTERDDYNNYNMILNSGEDDDEMLVKVIVGAYRALQ